MKKFFSLVLALVMALSLTTVAWGAEATVDNAADFKTKMEDTDTSKVTLGASFELNEMVTIPAGKTITLDLADCTITGKDTTSKNFGLITVSKGANLTVMGDGTITLIATTDSGWSRYSAVIANNQGTVTIKSGTIQHLGGTSMAYGIDNLTNGDQGDAYLYIEGGNIISTYYAIRQFANSDTCVNKLVISGGTIEGTSGGVFVHDSGDKDNIADLTITGGEITGTTQSIQIWDAGSTGTTTDGITVSITDGEINGPVVFDMTDDSAESLDMTISGGSFSDDSVAAYLADGLSIQPDGTVAATASFTGTSAITTTFSEEGTYYVLNANDVWEQVKYVPADDNGDGTGTVAHFKGTSGTTYIICKKNDDNALKLTSGYLSGDKLLNYVKVSVVDYSATATAVDASLYATCETDINAKGYKVVDAYGVVTYYKDPATGVTPTKYLLVDKEIKGVVAQVEGTDYVKGGHALIQNKSAAKDEAKTVFEYKCVICGDIFNGTKTKTAGVTYTKYTQPNAITKGVYAAAGYDMTKVTTGDLWLLKTTSYGGSYVGGTTTTTPSTDKVQSAETFDAGIAMYVGMSVVAAAGSAVVLKKKED